MRVLCCFVSVFLEEENLMFMYVYFPYACFQFYEWAAKVRSKKKNDIIWEFFPNVGPPPLLGTPYPKKTLVFILHFRT